MTAQPKLLRVLETRVVDSMGGQRPVRADLRLIAATNLNLKGMIRTSRFRADVHERLKMDVI